MLKWSKNEINTLKKNYQKSKKEIGKLLPNRTSQAINLMASKLNLRKIKNEYVKSDLSPLLEDTHRSFYWIGFLLADGSISKNRLNFSQSSKETMDRFTEFVNSNYSYRINNKKYEVYAWSCQDKFYLPLIKEKFDIKERKTYNPPNIDYSKFDIKLLISLFIGFIDGDGSICYQTNREDCSIRIKIHKSWEKWLIKITDLIGNYYETKIPTPKINKEGYLCCQICNSIIVTNLKKHIIRYKINAIPKKWNKINENFVSRYQIAKINKKEAKKLRKRGHTYAEISKKLKVSISTVYHYLK